MLIKNEIFRIKKDLSLRPKGPVDVLRGRFSGVPALVVSAGPSAIRWRQVYDLFKEPPLLVCVKHVIEINSELHDMSDLHFVNPYNLKRYCYDRNRVLSFYTKNYGGEDPIQPWDVCYEIDPSAGLTGKMLANDCDFESWTLNSSGLYRPHGPGIMHESVLFTLIHLGVSSIATVGWDIASPNGYNQHFNDLNAREDTSNIETAKDLRFRGAMRMVGLEKAYRIFSHYTNRTYDRIAMPLDEPSIISSSLVPLSDWLASKGVALRCYTNSPWIPDPIACRTIS